MSALIPTIIAALATPGLQTQATPREVVNGFFDVVRSGEHPEFAKRYMASSVAAHQVTSEGEVTIVRSPTDYAEHVREFRRIFGPFKLQIEEIIADGDRVYVRWKQTGHHLASLDGERPTGKRLTEVASAVYRVSNGRIAEYWIQADRKGLELQLAQKAAR